MRHTHHVNYDATRQVGFCSMCDFYGAMEFVWCNLISLNDKFSNDEAYTSMGYDAGGALRHLKEIIFYGLL